MKKLTGYWRQNRRIRGLAWTAVTLATMYALLDACLTWHWSRQWTTANALLDAEGETLDFRSIAKEPVPESLNFCALPLLKELSNIREPSAGQPDGQAGTKPRLGMLKLPEIRSTRERPKIHPPALGKPFDLVACAEWLRGEGSSVSSMDAAELAREAFAELSKHDDIIRELTAGLGRQKAQWTPEWKTRELSGTLYFSASFPHYRPVMEANQFLALRSIVAARNGKTAQAHESVLIMTRLTLANLNDPFIMGLLVAAADSTPLCGTIWALCEAQTGTVEDFARLETALLALNYRQAALSDARSEMSAAVNFLRSVGPSDDFEGAAGFDAPLLSRISRHEFFGASAAIVAEESFQHFIKPLRDQGWAEAVQSAGQLEAKLADMHQSSWAQPTQAVASMMLPSMASIIRKAAFAQTQVNQAVIACALERYRIENGRYPETLAMVTLSNGAPLPHDPMNQKPMGYRRTEDGKYALWGVGPDHQDHNGKRMLDVLKPEETKFDSAKHLGDWVWDFRHR